MVKQKQTRVLEDACALEPRAFACQNLETDLPYSHTLTSSFYYLSTRGDGFFNGSRQHKARCRRLLGDSSLIVATRAASVLRVVQIIVCPKVRNRFLFDASMYSGTDGASKTKSNGSDYGTN